MAELTLRRTHRSTSMSTLTSPDGTTIAYTRAGDGPPLVLVDGAMCYRGAGPMDPLAPLLQRSRRPPRRPASPASP